MATAFTSSNWDSEKRTPKEKAMDKLLFLYLIKQSNRRGRRPGVTRLQKTIFLMQENLSMTLKIKALNYKFFRYSFGPMSKEIYEDFGQLVENRFITDGYTAITSRGNTILRQFSGIFERNKDIMSFLDESITDYSTYDTDDLMKIAYDTEIFAPEFGIPLKIKDIPEKTDLLEKLEDKKACYVFDISEEEIEELDTLLCKEACDSLEEAIKDARTKPLLSYEEVFEGR